MHAEIPSPVAGSACRSTAPSHPGAAAARRKAPSSRSARPPRKLRQSAPVSPAARRAAATARASGRAGRARRACESARDRGCASPFPRCKRILATPHGAHEFARVCWQCIIIGSSLASVVTRLGPSMGIEGANEGTDGPGSGPTSGPTPSALYYTARTVVFADIVESVRLMQRDELTAAGRMRALLLEAAEEIVPRNNGHLLQRLGDGLMLDFSHPRDAAACARALHQQCADLSANLPADDR